MAEVSVMITTHQNPEGCYLTLFSALAQLEKSKLTWEIVIIADGGTEIKYEQSHPNVRVLRFGGGNKLGDPQRARHTGITNCSYSNVLCLDSHVVISSISDWIHQHECLNATISFPAMVGTSLEMFKIYGNQMDFDNCFWNVQTFSQPKSWEPFKVCQCAHSAFIIDRNWYMAGNGYTMEQKGYGGEEPWLSIWAWMMGGQVWFCPKIWHAHYMPIGRNDGAGQSDDFARNFMLCSYVMGGQEYLDKTRKFFSWAKPLIINPEIVRLRNRICEGPFGGDLNLLRSYFKKEGVVGG